MGERDEVRRLEDGLREALRPVAAPEGFAERVEARLRARRPESASTGVRWPGQGAGQSEQGPARWWRGAVAAVLLLAVLLGTAGWERRREERQRAEAATARAQFEVAMAVTARSLRKVEHGMERLAEKEETR